MTTVTRAKALAPDAVCAAAVGLARDAALDLAGADAVGEHLGVEADDERVVTHSFACLLPGYRGWRWSVTLARASRAKLATVDDACLLPGPDGLLPPPWVPWDQRLRPGDLGPGDLLPTQPDDLRLEPGWTGADEVWSGDPGVPGDAGELATLPYELGLGRARVLSLLGIDDAADRWLNGAGGPAAPLAEAAPARCATCGFSLRLGGLLGQAFGVCANEYSPSDGLVVSWDHGCGAHSEAVLATLPAPTMVVDEVGYDELGHG